MRHEIQKISKIVDEIINFCFLNATKKVNISIEEQEDAFIIEVESNHVDCSEERVEKLKELLNVQRQCEMEEYYWQLAGEDIGGGEFSLVGMMIDEAYVEYSCHNMKVKLVRYKKKIKD